MTIPHIIGLNGVARAGKDTIADILRNLYGHEPKSFSEVLNQALVNLNPWLVFVTDFGRKTGSIRYADYVEEHGYEKAKETPEVRRLLQAMGTEVGRNLLGADIWVDAMFNDVEAWGKTAIVNVRFPNEYQAVKDVGGVVWRVERPGFEPSNGHISDTALDGYEFDAVIQNDGTVHDLAEKVMKILSPVASHNPLQEVFNR